MAKRSGNGDVGKPTQEKLNKILSRARAERVKAKDAGDNARRIQRNLIKRKGDGGRK